MRWTAEVEQGSWLADRLDDPWRGTVHDVVPRGFDAYVRVLHPAIRDRPVGVPWPPLPAGDHRRAWETFQALDPDIAVEPVSWARTATAFGTSSHPLVAWSSLVAPGLVVAHEDGPRDAHGWRYTEPALGQLEPEVLARLASRLPAATTTPDDGHLALWEGWGGLLGHRGPTPTRAFLQAGSHPRHRRFLAGTLRDRFRSPFAQDRWQPGILPDDVSRGPRLALPHRSHVLFTAGIVELTEPDWALTAPWRDREAESHGFGPSALSPSLVWPADRAWVLVSEVDWDSSVVAGSAVLAEALCADPALEAHPIPPGAVLTAEG